MTMRDAEGPQEAGTEISGAPDAPLRLLWEKSRPALQVYLRSFSALGPEDVDEALQRTLIALWRKPGPVEPGARPWLFAVARNAAIDILRARSREARRRAPSSGEPTDPQSGPGSPYPRPEEAAIGAETEAFVARFLRGLADRDRELLSLAFAEGMSYPEISALVGRPLGTVKWRIAALKRHLARRYGKEFGDG